NTLERFGKQEVILKELLNSNTNDNWWFQEVVSHFKIDKIASNIVQCYGLTKHPLTMNYMLVLRVMDFDLKNYTINNFSILSWEYRYKIIYKIAACLDTIHKAGSVHRDLHP
ncbi:2021_t:CDS:2, partial [Scutellospora calospora]